jgi:hypothetical protein
MAAGAVLVAAEDLAKLLVELVHFVGALPDADLALNAPIRVALYDKILLNQPVRQR